MIAALQLLASDIAGAFSRGVAKLAEQFENGLYDWDEPQLAEAEAEHEVWEAPVLPLRSESDYLQQPATPFEVALRNLILVYGAKDQDLTDYLHQCINAWGRS